ncbi:PKD domain protein [compost metagenome]
MMQKIYTTILMIGFFAIGKIGFSQISLTQTTINNYVANICGTGISFSNVTLSGDSRAIANFTGGVSGGLGATMNEGLVMTTGLANTANGLTGTALKDNDNSGVNNIPQLNTIAGSNTFDGIILEFDFVPITSQINVNFQFGSEEYNWYVDQGYNDVFAFFISGPGITGSQNIALVPSTTTPVTINSINNGYAASGFFFPTNACASGPCNNCTYYNDNCSNAYNNAMNGFTKVLTASSAVIPCNTYHIRLMLADGFDAFLDSWVFIQKAGLYAVGTPPLSLSAVYPFGNALYEECPPNNSTSFTIPVAQATDYSFNVTWSGTATSGVDYDPLPTTITIPAGQTSVTIPINVLADGITEGTETIICTYPISVCSTGTTTINVEDAETFSVSAGPDADVCGSGSSATLSATQTGGTGSVAYSWDNGLGSVASVSVLPSVTTTYTVTATDQCGRTTTDQVVVLVGAPPVINAGTNTSICPGGNAVLSATGGVSYSWNNGLGAGNGVTVSPTATTAYVVTGTGANGCSATDTVTISVTAGPTVNAGLDQTICQGATISVSGSGAQTYSWNNGVSNGVSFSPTSTQTYTVTGTDANGCQGTDQVTITVNAPPAVDAGSPQAVCSGGSIILTGSGAQAYSWNNGVTNGVSFSPTSTQTYTVTGTDANGCQNTDQVTVTVNTASVVDAGSPQAVCSGVSVILTGSGAQTYTWNNGVTNGVSFVPASTQTYTVTGTDANGCTNTDQVVVTVNALPVVDAGSPQAVCSGVSVILTGSGAQTYTWNNGVTNGVSFTPTSTQTYTVTGTDANGCTNTDQVTITINPSPTVNGGADQSVCQGGNVLLTATGAQTYVWTNGVANGVAFTPGATATYTVTGTNANGCQGTDQVTVTVNPNPVVNAGANQVICLGSSVTLNGSGASSYSWSNGAQNNSVITPSLGVNTFVLTGTSALGCQGTDTLVITVIPVPTAGLGANTPVSGNPDLEVEFTNSSSDATTYDFDFGTGVMFHTTDLSSTPDHTYSIPGSYTVILTAGNGICSDTTHLTVTVLPYAPIIAVMPNIFTPNGDGNNDVFFIRLENVTSVEVTIVNRWGNTMAKISGINDFWDGSVNGNPAEDGVYFYNYTATGLDGTTQAGQGNIQLMR